MSLRRASLIGLACLGVAGILLIITGRLQGWQLFAFAAVFIAGIVFERSAYHRELPANKTLQFTGEVFEDPVSKKTVRVMYDPETGERYYDDTDNRNAR